MKAKFSDLVNKKLTSCNLCNKQFKTEKRVLMHLEIKHNLIEEIVETPKSEMIKEAVDENVTVTAIKSATNEIPKKEVDSKNQILNCQFCTFKVYEIPNLLDHLKYHLSPIRSIDLELYCAVEGCGQRFDYNLNSARTKIHKLKQLTHLEEHLRSKHTKTTNINCEECGKKFFSLMSLHYHKKQHEDSSKFYCYKCEHFIHSNIYKKHVSISNCARNAAFRCIICGKGFAQKKNLQNHQITHTNDKKYECSLCSKRFHQKGNLNTHKKKKHN